MKRSRKRNLIPRSLAIAALLVVGTASAQSAHGADPVKPQSAQPNLEKSVAEQARQIEELEASIRDMGARLDEADVNAAEKIPAAAEEEAPGEGVDQDYVDTRIQAFFRAAQSRFMISGYGTTGLVTSSEGTTAFGVSFNPAFHFRMTDRLHFNAELEMGYEVGDDREMEFEIDLEFAQIDYLATDFLVVSGGRFLTPFNSFGPRLHPTWINKLSTPPPIYGGHEGGGFIPVLKTVGGMLSGGKALWNDYAKINYGFYVGNGPTGTDLGDPPDPDELLDLEFNNTPDLDDGVEFGGRLGFLPIGNLELGASYMSSNPDDVRFHLMGLDGWYYYRGLELRAEWAYLKRDDDDVRANVQGYWVQAAYRFNRLFPDRSGWSGIANRLETVVRWGQVLDFPEKNRDQVAIGLDYWLFDSAPLKLSYEINNGAPDDNRFLLSFAYGF